MAWLMLGILVVLVFIWWEISVYLPKLVEAVLLVGAVLRERQEVA